MKTMTESITCMVLCILSALFCAILMALSISFHNWWTAIVDAILIVVNVILARKSYNRAKLIETLREARIKMIYDALPIHSLIIYRMMSEFLKDVKHDTRSIW